MKYLMRLGCRYRICKISKSDIHYGDKSERRLATTFEVNETSLVRGFREFKVFKIFITS
jgi:hypothetical protein